MKTSPFCLSKPWVTFLVMFIPVLGWTQIPDGYYDQAEGRTGSELKAALHDLISDHIKYPYTSGSTDVWDILKLSDEDPDSSENVILIYTGRSQAKTDNSGESGAGGGNLWNREHVWSKSHGFPIENDTAYTDCHHLRPADESVNSSRGTLDFDYGGSQHVEATECYYDGDSWEPRDAVKGDVARMMFYMVVRYDPGYHTDNTLYDLELVDFTGTATQQPTFGKLSSLLQWHALDPPDNFELNRNEVVYGFQGNRNPFIDHPEWADSIFAEQLSSNTRIGFTNTSIVVDEDAGSISLELSIINPDPTYDTQCEINLTGGNGEAADLDGFESTALTFPAGSNSLQTLDLAITDDDLAEEQETFILSISNVSGGDSAAVNGSETFVLTINPSDQESAVTGLIISEVMDGNRSGGQPKYIEITNTTGDYFDISGFSIWRGSNGATPAAVVEIPAGTLLPTAESRVFANNAGDMVSAGFPPPDQTYWGINGNGNDVYQLRTSAGELIDAFGLEGTTTPWYENSVAERTAPVVNGRASYDSEEWIITNLSVGYPDNGSPGTAGSHVFEPVSTENQQQPDSYYLMNTFPNPFNPRTLIDFNVPNYEQIQLDVFDIMGRQVTNILNQELSPGQHQVSWNGTNASGIELSSGIYFIRLSGSTGTQIQRVSILR
ncbi:endonuclease [bacterium]|nr:endonuclease [bacterium]